MTRTIAPDFAQAPIRPPRPARQHADSQWQANPGEIRLPPGARVRLRIAGAMKARILPMRFEKMAKATVIAIDGQPCDPFDPLKRQGDRRARLAL